MSDIIGTFGCSWSQDRRHAGGWIWSWSNLLSRKHPTKKFYNFALAGSCIRFSYEALKKFKKTFPQATTVFQLTLPHRITFGHTDTEIDFDQLTKSSANYWHLNEIYNFPFHAVNMGVVNGDWPDAKIPKALKQFYLDYFKFFPDRYERTALELYIEKIHQQVDFAYYQSSNRDEHLVSLCEKYNIPMTPFGNDEYQSHVIDHGNHINQEGNQKIADWISDQLDL